MNINNFGIITSKLNYNSSMQRNIAVQTIAIFVNKFISNPKSS